MKKRNNLSQYLWSLSGNFAIEALITTILKVATKIYYMFNILRIKYLYYDKEIFKYDHMYLKNANYGQVNADEPRFAIALHYLSSLPDVKTILDAGIGRGGFYNIIKNKFEVWGVEPSNIAIDKYFKGDERVLAVRIQDIPDTNLLKRRFDVVICLDVLEHIPSNELDKAIDALLSVGKRHFIFSIANHKDSWRGRDLHVSVFPFVKWEEKICKNFEIISKTSIHEDRARVYFLKRIEKEGKLSLSEYERKDKRMTPAYAVREMKKCTFSIIIPVYNHANYLSQALDSLLGQTHQDWEAVIVNDGSTDKKPLIMQQYARKDKRFKLLHKENEGTASALNKGIAISSGEWICWLSADDLFLPNKLEIHFKNIVAHPAIKFFHSSYYDSDDLARKINKPMPFPKPDYRFQASRFLKNNYVHGNSVAIHHSVFDNIGLFDVSLRQGQDFDMWLRISTKFRFHFINHCTCITRWHEGQTTACFPDGGYYESATSCLKFINNHGFEDIFPFFNLEKKENIVTATSEILYISLNPYSILYKCGYHGALIDKFAEWLFSNCRPKIRNAIIDSIATLKYEVVKRFLPIEINKSLQRIFNGEYAYGNHDMSEILKKQMMSLSEGSIKLKSLMRYSETIDGFAS